MIFRERVNSAIDIWSFGCLLYEVLTGTSLFCVMKFSSDEEESADDDHLLQMNDILDPLPDTWLKEKWSRANKHFGSNRERLGPNAGKDLGTPKDRIDFDVTGEDSARERVECEDGPWIDPPLEKRFEEEKPGDIDTVEAGVITSLIRGILRYEPSQRPSAAEILRHPWFEESA